jgi:diguanylate cyclase (GGDEF)-like protein/PAS domain S-box-containing protein
VTEIPEVLLLNGLEGLSQAVVATDREGRIRYWNPAASALYGYQHGEAMGQVLSDLIRPLPPEAAGSETTRAKSAWAGSGPPDDGNWIVRHQDGHFFVAHVSSSPVLDARGTAAGRLTLARDVTTEAETQAELSHLQALHSALVLQALDWGAVLDAEGRLRYVTPGITQGLGYTVSGEIGRPGADFVHPEDLAVVNQELEAIAGGGSTGPVLFRARHASGDWRWVEMVFTNRLDDPNVAGLVCNGRDVTRRVQSEQALRASELRYRTIADTAQEGIWACDPGGQTLYANEKLAQILGLPLETVYTLPAAQIIDPSGTYGMADLIRRRATLGADRYEITYRRPDERSRVLHLSVSPLPGAEGPMGTLAMISDVTQSRRSAQELRRRALRDELTGLANRTLLSDRLEQALSRTRKRGTGATAVLFADLDRFKLINDGWGHSAGDSLLVQVARRLEEATGPHDAVARFGGDEFVVVVEDTDEAMALDLAERLLSVLSEPYCIDDRRMYLTASIGISLSPPMSGPDLLRLADAAMYEAKAAGRAKVRTSRMSSPQELTDRLNLNNDLRDALAHDQLELHYQPVVELATGRIVGVEALARWNHPQRGSVSPALFVPVAESTGMGPQLDRWVLQRACRDRPHIERILGPGASISVNVSAAHLAEPDFEQSLVETLQEAGTPFDRIVLEITESAVMADPEKATAILGRLRGRGMATAIDDFGTGYSSLGYLHQLPVSSLKIDHSFVERMVRDLDALAITASVMELARNMKLKVVAEGVERLEQLEQLAELGCPLGQGYLWSPALPLDELARLVSGLRHGAFEVSAPGPAQLSLLGRGGEPPWFGND